MTEMPRRPSEPSLSEQRAAFRAMLARRVFVVTSGLTLLALLGGMAYTILTIRASQVTNTKRSVNSAATLKAVLDCTEEDGACYKRGQEQTAAAVGDINRVVILAAACSVGLDQRLTVAERQDAIQTCVIDRLAARR